MQEVSEVDYQFLVNLPQDLQSFTTNTQMFDCNSIPEEARRLVDEFLLLPNVPYLPITECFASEYKSRRSMLAEFANRRA